VHSKNYIGGEWRVPTGGEIIVANPSNTAKEVGVIHLSTVTDALEASLAARQALSKWSKVTGAARAEYLHQMATALQNHLAEIAELASQEMGKPISEMRGEVMRGVHLLRYYAAEGVRANGTVIPSSAEKVMQYTKRVPLGVVALITPWNFPVAIPIWKLAPALISGNTVIWKPAEFASLTATRLTELFAEAGLPPGVLNLVVGKGSVVGNGLLTDAALDGVSFTGSTATGTSIAVKCAARNIKFQTEMGGKNAAIVLNDADIQKTVPALLSGAFRSAGQKCTATSRIIVEDAIYETLVKAIQQEVAKLHVGEALDPLSYLGPVAAKSQYETVMSYVNLARRDARILAEGTTAVARDSGYYVMPLVVDGVDSHHQLVQEEIFGPVAALIRVSHFEAAIELCNESMYGLSASLFTQDLSNAFEFLEQVDAGMVRVNQETAGVEYQAPFGGMKWSSSHTREQGQTALDFYSQVKTCAIAY